MNLKSVADKDLITNMDSLVQTEREVLTKVLHHLREIEVRRLFSSLGYKSLFDYAVKRLGYSDDQAARRISAMRLLKEIPELESKIADGSLTLTNIGMAQILFRREKPLREEKIELLAKLENKSKREAEKIIVEKSPEALKADRIRHVTDSEVEVRYFAKERLLEKLDRVKGLIASSKGDLGLADLTEAMCDIAIEKLTPKPPAPVRRQRGNKTISKNVRRQVWQKACSKCENCGSTYRLEVDHVKPLSMGGTDDIDNLRLLCRSCNQRAAISNLGMDKMRGFFE